MKSATAGLRSRLIVEGLNKQGKKGGALYRVIICDNCMDRSTVCATLATHPEVLSVLPSTDERCFTVELEDDSDPAVLHHVQDMVISLQ